MLGWLSVAFVILLSGFLAYYGDIVGRKMGKKRLVIGRLRPRHTAAIMTALFGMIGAALAIGALLLVSEPVRKMLFEGDKVRKELDLMQSEQAKLRGDLAQRQGQIEQTQKEFKSEQKKVQAERNKFAKAQAEVAQLQTTAKTLTRQAGQIRSQLTAVRRQLSVLRPEFQRLQREKARVEAAKNYANAELNKINARNLKLEAEIKDKETKANERIAGLQSNINELNKSFGDLQEEFAKQALQNREEMRTLREDVEKARSALTEAQRELEITKSEAEKLGGTTAISRTQPLIFSKDDELARIPVRSRLNGAEARSYLLALISQAGAVAKAAGAKSSLPGASEAVLPELLDRNQKVVTAEEQVRELVQKLTNLGQDHVLLASAIFNSFLGEPVGLRIRILPNPIVYKQGQIIAETRVDGQLSQDQIIQAISKFLEQDLAPKARRDGIIPMLGSANPLGEIVQEDLLDLVADIKSRPFTSRVKFVAAQETRAGDRLKMEFKVS